MHNQREPMSLRYFANASADTTASPVEDENNNNNSSSHRHGGIQMHPDSISGQILPGGTHVERNTIRGGTSRKYVEMAYGYFWMLKDMRQSDEKPIQSSVIAEDHAKVFPNLHGLTSLAGTTVDLPEYALRQNRSRDPKAQTTLIVVSFRDFGYQLLSSWIEPYENSIVDKSRNEVLQLTISEGYLNKWLKSPLESLMRRNTPEQHWDRTLTYFGNDADISLARDSLRMHNSMTGYVFILDGVGRVRYAGSGRATDEEAQEMVQLALSLRKSSSTAATKTRKRKP